MQHPTINPLGDTFGAEVVGLDLSQPIEPAVVEELNQALLDNIVLVIRDQDLTAQEFRNGMANFGEPMLQHREAFRLPECPDVSRIINREKMRPAAMWHTDHTNHERPPKATILYARKLPAEGGDTCFANMYAGLDNLSEDSRAQIEDLVTLNSMEPNNPTYSAGDRDEFAQAVRHPMVRTHPETGKKALYFHVSKALDIDGMETPKVRPFLDDLLDQAIKPENSLRHHWTLGDVVICDNRCAVHRADPNYDQAEERLLWRIILQGDKPVK
ncbi:MAG: TauD/TfdA family dioxygenase [Rhodospirillaceae bacterium]|jgi:alpha-ketoglutarate-dependent taurine dioxygenase|nr:TauD/TfdA family dioxygenase [Rhodospirillaceae bacterium]MBT5812104.1 TauD/TfdA family dioxygenase [Rhodospirillaceae bacterium]